MNRSSPVSTDWQAILQRRAEVLSRRREDTKEEATVAALGFRCSGERFALPLQDLAEVAPFRGCALVPGGRPEMMGVVAQGGGLRKVADLSRLLGLPVGERRPGSGFVIFLKGDAALRVDHLEPILEVALQAPASPARGDVHGSLKRLLPDGRQLLDAQALRRHPIFSGESEPNP